MSQRTDSTTGMSPERFAAILQREAAATPGHWGTYYDPQGTYSVEAQPRLIPGSGSTIEGLVATIRVEDSDAEQAYCNAAFIAHAREDVPALLAEVERLRAERDQFAERVDTLTAVCKITKQHVQIKTDELNEVRGQNQLLARWRREDGTEIGRLSKQLAAAQTRIAELEAAAEAGAR